MNTKTMPSDARGAAPFIQSAERQEVAKITGEKRKVRHAHTEESGVFPSPAVIYKEGKSSGVAPEVTVFILANKPTAFSLFCLCRNCANTGTVFAGESTVPAAECQRGCSCTSGNPKLNIYAPSLHKNPDCPASCSTVSSK